MPPQVQYQMQAIVKPHDPCIEALAVSGALQTARFLDGRKGERQHQVASWKGWPRGQPPYPFTRPLRGARAREALASLVAKLGAGVPALEFPPRWELPRVPQLPLWRWPPVRDDQPEARAFEAAPQPPAHESPPGPTPEVGGAEAEGSGGDDTEI
jgi:hypothetical protein